MTRHQPRYTRRDPMSTIETTFLSVTLVTPQITVTDVTSVTPPLNSIIDRKFLSEIRPPKKCHLAGLMSSKTNTSSPVETPRTEIMTHRSERPEISAGTNLRRVRDIRHNPVDNPVDKVSLWITCGLFIAPHNYADGTPRPAMPEHMFPNTCSPRSFCRNNTSTIQVAPCQNTCSLQ